MVPSGTSGIVFPASTAASVLLPDPLGPIIAWISPGFTSRLIPFRISSILLSDSYDKHMTLTVLYDIFIII
jgi:hypothetical protein